MNRIRIRSRGRLIHLDLIESSQHDHIEEVGQNPDERNPPDLIS